MKNRGLRFTSKFVLSLNRLRSYRLVNLCKLLRVVLEARTLLLNWPCNCTRSPRKLLYGSSLNKLLSNDNSRLFTVFLGIWDYGLSSICKTNGTQENYLTVKNNKITHRLALGAIKDSFVSSCSAGFWLTKLFKVLHCVESDNSWTVRFPQKDGCVFSPAILMAPLLFERLG